MGRKIIAIDVDDVLADLVDFFRIHANKHFGFDLQPEHYRVPGDYWGYYEMVWQSHGGDKNVTFEDIYEKIKGDEDNMPLLPGASFAIGELTKKFDIAIITAREPSWEDITLKWLKKHFGDVFIGVYFAGRYTNQKLTKGQICKQVGASWLIDDHIHHCKGALEEGVEPLLFGDYGWHSDIPEGITRVKDWPAVLDYFNGQE